MDRRSNILWHSLCHLKGTRPERGFSRLRLKEQGVMQGAKNGSAKYSVGTDTSAGSKKDLETLLIAADSLHELRGGSKEALIWKCQVKLNGVWRLRDLRIATTGAAAINIPKDSWRSGKWWGPDDWLEQIDRFCLHHFERDHAIRVPH